MPEDVETVLRREELLPSGVECKELESSTFSMSIPGQMAPARVTASPAIFDDHFESHQLVLLDSPICRKMIELSGAESVIAAPDAVFSQIVGKD